MLSKARLLAGTSVLLLALSGPLAAQGADAASAEEPQEAGAAIAPVAPVAQPDPGPIAARLVVSQFVDRPISGDAEKTLRYSGRADAYVDIGGSSFGADDSLTLTIRPEFTWGKDSNGTIGLIPNNTALFRGEGREDFDLSVSISKRWNSGAKLIVGKVNVLDQGGRLPVVGSDGHYGFQNLSMALPPSAIIPNTITGALLEVPTEKVLYRLWVFDPDSQYGRSGFETAFGSGVGFLGSVTFPVKIGGKPGYYALKLSGSTRNDINADSLPAVLIPAPGSGFGTDRGEFAAVLAGYQYLGVYPEAPGKGWGIFGQVYLSKGDPTFLDKSGFIGISGNPRARPQDRFGLAWFRYSLTDGLVDALANRIPLEDEEGVEAFYTLGIGEHLQLTADVQLVDSAIAPRDTGVIAGLRLTAAF
ncbi:carbohydrate porin [Altererythrobacter arenosus]|uniref:Carbohydrate porin n=1 Tax=Altererythrobacter arenosus TaxID=3032592 RepID=A0ABY8FU10_9SPHN|nr:carbohydrate porin [Altererythrobacter sp. CAU 1644]WFL78488.1 carbohydrate porin [Altererythrobacter sp. CAU 1644]